MKFKNTPRVGFTLIELIIVMGILAVLLSVVIIAVNPMKQFSDTNDTKRRSDTKAILDAIEQYSVTNKGDITFLKINAVSKNISNTETGEDFCNALVPTYLAALPSDPTRGVGVSVNGARVKDCLSVYDTGYSVLQDPATHRITVSAISQSGETLSLTR